MKKTIVTGFVLVLTGFSMLVASAGFKKREFTGNAVVQICSKDSSGRWQLVDELNSPLRFEFNIADVARDKGLDTAFSFSGRSKKGLQISAKLKRGATGNSDLTSGLVSLDLPLEILVDGKKADAVFKFTTESAPGAAGNISGRRAKINEAARSADLGMVSSVVIPDPGVINHEEQIAKREDKKESIADQKKIIAEKKEDLLIVISGNGLLKSLEQ